MDSFSTVYNFFLESGLITYLSFALFFFSFNKIFLYIYIKVTNKRNNHKKFSLTFL